jgi:Xaa-Pro dipeptidase
MELSEKIRDVQRRLVEQGIGGWLLYDFHRRNELAVEFLAVPEERHLTRRFFYWIPARGEPVQIVHQIESTVLEHLPGEKRLYLRWQTLDELLAGVLKGAGRVAMEYSPLCAIPYVSKVDGGVVDLVRAHGVEVVSSAPFLQHYTAVWDEAQLASHLAAAEVLDKTVAGAWQLIAEALKKNQLLTEYDVQQWILGEFERLGCVTDVAPNCSVNAHSADPHYEPQKEGSSLIQKGDFILIDLWCKQKHAGAVYADITRVGVADEAPTLKQKEIFEIVRTARDTATAFIQGRLERKEEVKGFEVDLVCRQVIADAGYGEFFTHRTGHNIHTQTHGPGANIDSLETLDERPLIPRTCFSIEPGIYLQGSFGVRLEYDVYISKEGKLHITGGIQAQLNCLL